MAALRGWPLVALLALAAFGSANAQGKNAAIDKVVDMLETLQTKVMEEGEKEADTYNKFACFCKDMTKEKTELISSGEDEKETLSSTITELAADRGELDEQIEELTNEIAEAEKEMKTANQKRSKELKEYTKNEADLSGGITALKGAILTMKASKSPSLVQIQSVARTVRMAALMADALGLDSGKANQAMSTFLQEGEVPTQDYDFHSGDIIEMLEKLLVDFKDEKNSLDEDEVKEVASHDEFIQKKTDFVKTKNDELSEAQETKSKKQEEIATNSQQLTTIVANLLDDQEYLKKLADVCHNKAKTWDQRTQCRQDELSALTAAITIIKGAVTENTSDKTVRFAQQGVSVRMAEAVAKDENAMDAMEADAESADAAPGFLQRKMQQPARKLLSALAKKHEPEKITDGGRATIIALLRSKGQSLKSNLLSALAEQIAADPFKKIKKLIQELIERLLQEAGSEANHKGWCDKSIADAETKRNRAAEDIGELNGAMSQLEASRDKLVQELSVLEKEIAELKAAQDKAEKQRSDEKTENTETVEEAKQGLEALMMAIDVLEKFYKTAAKNEASSLLQQGPADDMPDSGFDEGEAYKGAQGTSGGILGMLDVIKSDFKRTIKETEAAEEQAEDDHNKFMTESGVSLAEKEIVETESKKYKDDAEEKLASSEEDLHSKSDMLKTAIKELLELQPACIDTGMSYQERVDRRNQEIDSLKKALCILTAFAEFGEGASTNDC